MRRAVCFLLCVVLAALVTARAALPRSAPAAVPAAIVTDWDSLRYNVLPLALPPSSQTAGSAVIAQLDQYYLSRVPTEKNAYTGALAGKNLVLILAESWRPGQPDSQTAPALWRLWSEGVRCGQFCAPDWFQGSDGRQFALLAGMTPTTVWGRSALAWTGERQVYLPFALARCLSQAGYTCLAYPRSGARAAYEALGFDLPETAAVPDVEILGASLPEVMAEEPFFAYYEWNGEEGDMTLSWLLWALEQYDHSQDTAVCLVTGGEQLQGQLVLWGGGLPSGEVAGPCSELDVTPTLLNLLGVEFDARFLSGRDIFSSAAPLVSLYGSAYSDWVTDAGYFQAAENAFSPRDGRFSGEQEAMRYVRQIRRQVYDNYVYARRIMENDYFRIVMER